MLSEGYLTPAAVHMKRLRDKRRAEGKCQRCGQKFIDSKCYHCVPLSLRRIRKRKHTENYKDIALRKLKNKPKNIIMVEWMKKYGCSTSQLAKALQVSQRMVQRWCIEGDHISQDSLAKLKVYMYQVEQSHSLTNTDEA